MPDGRLGYGQLGDFILGSTGTPAGPGGDFDLQAIVKATIEKTFGLAAEISGTNVPYLDDFTRSVDPGIGDSRYTSDDEASAYVNGSELRVRTTGWGDAFWTWSGAPRVLATYSFDFYVPALGDTSSYYEVDTRKVAYNGTFWRSRGIAEQDGSVNDRWWITGWAGSSADKVYVSITPDRSSWYTLKWEIDPTVPQLRLKVWKTSDPEPGWQYLAPAEQSPGSPTTAALYIHSATTEEARFDNLRADEFIPAAPATEFSLDAVIASAPHLMTLDAVKHRLIEPPVYIATASFVNASTATVNSNSVITIPPPSGIVQGDLLVAVLSADSTTTATISFTPSTGWTLLGNTPMGDPFHHLVSFYRWVEDPSEGITITHRIGSTTPQVTAKAGTILAFRNAAVPIFRASNAVASVNTNNKVTPSWSVQSTDPNYRAETLVLAAFAGGSTAGPTTWTPVLGSTVERADVSAATNANLLAATYIDALDNFIDSRAATPSQAEFNLTQIIQIPGRSTTFGLSAWKGHGFPFNAYIQAATHTTHPRTGPHTGVHLDTAIVSSALLGSLPSGTDYNTVLADLDALLTDLENKA